MNSLNFPAGRSCSALRLSPPVMRRWSVRAPNVFLPSTKYFGPMRSLWRPRQGHAGNHQCGEQGMVAGQRDSIPTCYWLWGKVECVPNQSWRLDSWTRRTHMDRHFSNSGGHWGTSLCLPRHSIRLLDTLPSLPLNLSYQSQSPLICGFYPTAYAQPWLGLHNLNLPHAPSFDGGQRARDVLKEAITCSSQGRPVSKARLSPLPPPPQHPR